MENEKTPGKGLAIASLVLGIIAVALWFFGYSSIVSVVLGIIGIILASSAKKKGFDGGVRVAGLVLSIIGLIGGAVAFVACVACTSGLKAVADSMNQ